MSKDAQRPRSEPERLAESPGKAAELVQALGHGYLRELKPYPPGKPIDQVQRELGVSRAIKLASNESPLGPSPLVRGALEAALAELHRYPDGACYRLRQAVAKKLDCAPEQLIFGAGVDEVLSFSVKACVGPGDEVVFPWPSFAMYPIAARAMGGTPVPVPLDAELQVDIPRLLAAITPRTKLVFLANPNNPTGRTLGAAEFARLVAGVPERVLLVIDEAYFEFARRPDFPDALALVRERPTALVTRTFSKAYGLAGIRVGYGVGSAELIDLLERTRQPFNVNALAQAAAEAALADQAHLARALELNRSGLEQLERGLREFGYRCVPSEANFVLVEVGPDAAGLEQRLLRRGIIVRGMRAFGLERHLRITVGLPEEHERLLEALRAEQAGGAR